MTCVVLARPARYSGAHRLRDGVLTLKAPSTQLTAVADNLQRYIAVPNTQTEISGDASYRIDYLGHGPGGEGARRSLSLGLSVLDHLGLNVAGAVLSSRLLAEVHRGLEQPAGMSGATRIQQGVRDPTRRNDKPASKEGLALGSCTQGWWLWWYPPPWLFGSLEPQWFSLGGAGQQKTTGMDTLEGVERNGKGINGMGWDSRGQHGYLGRGREGRSGVGCDGDGMGYFILCIGAGARVGYTAMLSSSTSTK